MDSRTHEWLPRLFDLTFLDFYFWRYIEQKVHAEEPTTVENMKERIREICTNINADILQKVRDDFRHRLNICIQVNGGLFEYLQ